MSEPVAAHFLHVSRFLLVPKLFVVTQRKKRPYWLHLLLLAADDADHADGGSAAL